MRGAQKAQPFGHPLDGRVRRLWAEDYRNGLAPQMKRPSQDSLAPKLLEWRAREARRA